MKSVWRFLDWFTGLPIPMMVDHGAAVRCAAAVALGCADPKAQADAAEQFRRATA